MTGNDAAYNAALAALDRCEHGRHSRDNCFSCPGGHSTGNLFLLPGTRIGTNLCGEPIVAPPQHLRGDPHNWAPASVK